MKVQEHAIIPLLLLQPSTHPRNPFVNFLQKAPQWMSGRQKKHQSNQKERKMLSGKIFLLI